MKKLSLLLIIVSILTILCACNGPKMESVEDLEDEVACSMFVLIEHNTEIGYKIVYHRDTKVMYAISSGYYNSGTFTVMLNADGTPMVYGGT